jgi:serine/threonine protein kinase
VQVKVSLPLHKVKPPNLLVDCHMQQVKLADFGVSKILETSGHAGLD